MKRKNKKSLHWFLLLGIVIVMLICLMQLILLKSIQKSIAPSTFSDAKALSAEQADSVRRNLSLQFDTLSIIFIIGILTLFCFFAVLDKKRMRTATELKNTLRNLSAFLEERGDALFTFDARLLVLHASASLENLLGYPLPREWFSLVSERQTLHPEFDYRGVIETYNEILFSGEYREMITCIRSEENGLRWLRIAMSASLDADEKVSGVIGTVTDVTEQYADALLPQNAEGAEAPQLPIVQDRQEKKVRIHAFGYFDVFVNEQPISFAHEKSKEMLAVLVDRRGGFVSSSEMIGYLWEDEASNKTTQSRCRQVASRLKRTLEEYAVGDIIETVNGKRRIVPEKVDCDYFNYLKNKPEYQHLFTGAYMINYSWGEITLADIGNM